MRSAIVMALTSSSVASSSWKAGCRSSCLIYMRVMNSCMSQASFVGVMSRRLMSTCSSGRT